MTREPTPRQVEALTLLLEGWSRSEVARQMGISEHTLRHHLDALYGRLGVTNKAEALRWYWTKGPGRPEARAATEQRVGE